MELFNEAKNRLYECLGDLINTLASSQDGVMTRKELKAFLDQRGAGELEEILLVQEDDLSPIQQIDKDIYGLHLYQCLHITLFSAEKIWLNQVLEDPKARLFLSKASLIKLKQALAQQPKMLEKENLELKNNVYNDSQEIELLQENFALLVQAIRKKKGIIYSYKNKKGEILKQKKAFPYKIEYGVKYDCFYLISYSLTEKRPIKNLLKNIFALQLVPLNQEVNFLLQEMQESIRQKKVLEPLVLLIKNQANALERTFYLFSCFAKKARYLPEKNLHELTVYYYQFEEAEVLSRVFSSGTNVLIQSPARLRKIVKERIKKALEIYQRGK